MYVHFTNTQLIIGGFALFLIIIFALSAFLDKRWRTVVSLRALGADHKPYSLRQSSSCDDKDGSSNLYERYADLSARSLGTAEQRITFRGKSHQNAVGGSIRGLFSPERPIESDSDTFSAPPLSNQNPLMPSDEELRNLYLNEWKPTNMAQTPRKVVSNF
ncbi:hypothetical protein P8935_01735 [Telmatobacter sp. DSM 110680]|uniref:Uncharacterized protein n=1 Tax=Telmatobacter sp. DSM 110680 TaxID=3036704 RepID=A0AAU7DLU9_9BACT